jgi:hypothetical protein
MPVAWVVIVLLGGAVVYLDAQATTPLPTVPVLGLAVESCNADKFVITAPTKDCARVITSTKGSTSTMHRRTLRCVK